MNYVQRLVRHERLMTRMADRNGADIDLALMVGAISPGDLHESSVQCMGCTHTSDCEKRLDAGTPGIPEFCRNAEVIDELRTLMNTG